jgi:hypothetical protein
MSAFVYVVLAAASASDWLEQQYGLSVPVGGLSIRPHRLLWWLLLRRSPMQLINNEWAG